MKMQKSYQQQNNFYISKTDNFWEITSFNPKQASRFLFYSKLLSISLITSFMLAPTIILILGKENNEEIILGITAIICLIGGIFLIKNIIQKEILPLWNTYRIKSYADKIICSKYYLPFVKQVILTSTNTIITTKKLDSYTFLVLVKNEDTSFVPLKQSFLYEKDALELVNILSGTTTSHLTQKETKAILPEMISNSSLTYYSKAINTEYNHIDLTRSIIKSTLVACLGVYPSIQGLKQSIFNGTTAAVLIFGIFSLLTLFLFLWLLKDLVKNYLISTYHFSPKGIQKYIRLFPFIKFQKLPKETISLLSILQKRDTYHLNIVLENGQQQTLDIQFKTKEQALSYKEKIENVLNL